MVVAALGVGALVDRVARWMPATWPGALPAGLAVLEPLAWAGLGRPIKLKVFAEDGSGHRTEIGNRQLK